VDEQPGQPDSSPHLNMGVTSFQTVPPFRVLLMILLRHVMLRLLVQDLLLVLCRSAKELHVA